MALSGNIGVINASWILSGPTDNDNRHGPGVHHCPASDESKASTGQPEESPAPIGCRFADCGLIAQPSPWSEALTELGVRAFKRPEALYKRLRSREFLPEACIVDLDTLPRNLVRALDIRVPCPKIWIGRSAANPADIKNPGIYYSRAHPEELNDVVNRLTWIERAVMLPSAVIGGQVMPLLVSDEGYRNRLHYQANQLADTNRITLHGDDPLELQSVAQYLAVETQRARIWAVRSPASIHSVLRKISQARRPGADVTIMVYREVDTESARELYKAMPADYSMIKLASRADEAVDAMSFTLPRPGARPSDIECWITWFISRSTIEHGVALSGMAELVPSITRTLGENPPIDEIRSVCGRSVRQHATLMEDQGRYTSYEDLVHNFERTVLRQALTQHEWNLSAAARSLGLAESSLRYKLNKLGLSRGTRENE